MLILGAGGTARATAFAVRQWMDCRQHDPSECSKGADLDTERNAGCKDANCAGELCSVGGIYIFNRTLKKAQVLADEFGGHVLETIEEAALKHVDVIVSIQVHCTYSFALRGSWKSLAFVPERNVIMRTLQINTRPPACKVELPQAIWKRRPLAVEFVYAPAYTSLVQQVISQNPYALSVG